MVTQNGAFNNDLLKRGWRFPGLVMSDWDAACDTIGAAHGGLDLEMPSGKFLNRTALLPAIQAGTVARAAIDDKVRRLLRTAVRFGWLDRPAVDYLVPRYSQSGRQAALIAAREGMVLLKNGLLPFDKKSIHNVAWTDPAAEENALNPAHDHDYPAPGGDRIEYKEEVFVGTAASNRLTSSRCSRLDSGSRMRLSNLATPRRLLPTLTPVGHHRGPSTKVHFLWQTLDRVLAPQSRNCMYRTGTPVFPALHKNGTDLQKLSLSQGRRMRSGCHWMLDHSHILM